MMNEEESRQRVEALQNEFYSRDDAFGWFDALYAEADGDASRIPWADLKPNRNFLAWLKENPLKGEGKKAVVVGCGLGDDAEKLAKLGFEVTAFDISPKAIEWAKKISPDSRVNYSVENLFELPEDWQKNFDFVLEIYTIQALPLEMRNEVIEKIAALVKENGELLVIGRGRDDDEPISKLPFPLAPKELETFEKCGLKLISFEDFIDDEAEPKRRFRVLYEK